MTTNQKYSLQIPTQYGIQEISTTVIENAEARIHEIAYVTPQKAGELLAAFNEAHLHSITVIAQLELALRQADKKADMLRSVIVLDEAKDILKAKGLFKESNPAGSEDLRRAILDGSPAYQEALDKVAELQALVELFRGKSKSIEMAYHSTKRLVSDTYVPSYRETRTNGMWPEEQQVPAKGYFKPKL